MTLSMINDPDNKPANVPIITGTIIIRNLIACLKTVDDALILSFS